MPPDVLPLRPVGGEAQPTDSRPDPNDHARLIDREELAHRLSVGVSTLDRLRAAGKVGPRAIKCGGVRFLLSEVAAWLSTPTPTGELHDAETWQAVWPVIQTKVGSAGR